MTTHYRNIIWRNILWMLPLLLAGCAEPTDGDRNRVVAQQADEAPVTQRVDGGAMTAVPADEPVPAPRPFVKVLAVDMSVDKQGAVQLKNPRVQYGEPPNQTGNPPMFTAQLLNRAGGAIVSVPLWDPRWTFVWSEDKDRDFVDLAESAETVVIVPFDGAMTTMTIVKDKERVASVDLADAIAGFCAKNREDPDCRKRPAPNPSANQKPQ